ncbi:MAG TPA: LamG domain-containing protein [Candidatus Acidoferrum sp.]|jgi:hypothetical protein|nr:LamG domain-containing protein [Candidatus Acidoferrum sp.]
MPQLYSKSANRLRFSLLSIFFVLTPAMPAQQPVSLIQWENSKPGTSDWIMSLVAHDRTSLASTNTEIEGYASLTSVNRGGSISFFVNTPEPTYAIEFFRMGWYQGTGGRRMSQPVLLPGTIQPIPTPASDNTLLLECNWTNPYTITIPTNAPDADGWVSGFYVAKLTSGASQHQNYIPFVVRDDQRVSTYLYQWPCNTYEAYNNWAGISYYANSNTNLAGLAHTVSFNRPFVYIDQYFDYESMMISFLERQGFDVSYCSSLDAHEQGNLLLNHRVFLTVGHDEYWSWAMRQNVETARDSGISLAFFSGNTCYWQVRFEPSGITGALDRTMVCYKYSAYQLDPFATGGNPSQYPFITTLWRNNSVKPPEDALVGVLYGFQVTTNIVIYNPSHWVCAGTGFTNGSVLQLLAGYEIDGLGTNTPVGTALIAHSPVAVTSGTNHLLGYSDMTMYTAQSGSDVFGAGTVQFAQGFDPLFVYGPRPLIHPNPGAQQMTRNILARLARCAGPQSNMVSWWAGERNGSDELGRNPVTFPQGVSFTNGMAGQAFWFNGTNQYLVVTNASTTNWIVSQISLDAWVMPAQLNAIQGIIFAAADASGSPWCTVAVAADGTLQLRLTTTNNAGSTTATYLSGSPILQPGKMQHLAITADVVTNQILAFVNGAPVPLGLQPGPQPVVGSLFPNASQFYIGGVPQTGSSNFYHGLIDEVGLYARVLSTNDVLAIYNARSGGRCGEAALLTVTTMGSTNRLSWPLAALGFVLQSSTILSGAWTQETNAIVMNGDRFVFDVSRASGQKFFRLTKIAN